MKDSPADSNLQPNGSISLLLALNSIATALQGSIRDEENVYSIFQDQVVGLGLRGGISEFNDESNTLTFKTVASTNPFQKVLKRFEKNLKTSASGYTVDVNKVDVYHQVTFGASAVFVPDTSKVSAQVVPQPIKGLIQPLLTILGHSPGIFAPLIYDGKVKGMLNIVGPNLTQADVPTMQAFANQIAVALQNARLVHQLQSANDALECAYQRTLEGWVQALELRDHETEGHTLRVADVTVRLAEFMGIPKVDLNAIRQGALLHDIGKMAIPDEILLKPGPLTADEWTIMQQHPETAYKMLRPIEHLNKAIQIPHCHHEHWDGSGYPQGLKSEKIPYWARIFTVVDIWDAMLSDRPYRKALPLEETMNHILSETGRIIDPDVKEAFFSFLGQYSEINNIHNSDS